MSDVDPHIFEMAMLLCFGCSWPFVIAKTIRTKTVRGKSFVFIVLAAIGYISGIVSKLAGEFDHVFWFYVINGSMVTTEMVLYIRYRQTDEHRNIQIVKPQWQDPDCSLKHYGWNNPEVQCTLAYSGKHYNADA